MPPALTTPRSLPLVRDPATRSAPRLVARLCAFGGGGREGLSSGEREREDGINEDGVVRTLLIDNYDSYTYNIYQELSVVNGGRFLIYFLSLLSFCRIIPGKKRGFAPRSGISFSHKETTWFYVKKKNCSLCVHNLYRSIS